MASANECHQSRHEAIRRRYRVMIQSDDDVDASRTMPPPPHNGHGWPLMILDSTRRLVISTQYADIAEFRRKVPLYHHSNA